jgi:ankyrin repeat protein
MKVLLKNGAKVDLPLTGDHSTALAAAAFYEESTEPLEILINAGAELNSYRGNALEAAAVFDNYPAIDLLCRQGAKVNLETEEYGSPLCAAAAEGNIRIINQLYAKGADVNLMFEGTNALAAAVEVGGPQAVSTLIGLGADVTMELQGGSANALELASLSTFPYSDEDREEMIRLLIAAGAVWPQDTYFSDVSSWFD